MQTENKLSFSECNPTIKQTENVSTMLGSAGPCYNKYITEYLDRFFL